MEASTAIISKSSWSYWLATEYGKMSRYGTQHGTDICTYRKHILKGLWNLFVGVFLGGSILVTLISLVIVSFAVRTYYGVTCMVTDPSFFCVLPRSKGTWEGFDFGGFVIYIIIMFTALTILWEKSKKKLVNWLESRPYTETGEKVQKPPNGFVLAYRSWKEKVCYKVDFQ